MEDIRKAIITDKRTINSFTLQNGEGGYSGSKLQILSSITLYRQIPRLIKKVRTADADSFNYSKQCCFCWWQTVYSWTKVLVI
nr:DUF2179 domain-containing protein [Mycoplasmopsis bovis]